AVLAEARGAGRHRLEVQLPGHPLGRGSTESVGVAGGVGVEAGEVAAVVDAVDGRGTHAVGVIHGGESAGRGPGETVHDRGAAGAHRVGAHDLPVVVDAQRHGGGSAGEGQVGEVAAVLGEPVCHPGGRSVEPGDVA